MNKEEKIACGVIFLAVLLILYYINKKYLYVLDVEFDTDSKGELAPKSMTLKSGFILPVKTFFTFSDGASKKVKWYGYKISSIKREDGYDVLLNSKKIYTVYNDSWYEENKSVPTGRILI